MTTQPRRYALIIRLQLERAWFETLLAGLTAEQMEQPGVEEDWSVKDIVAHLTIWERRGTRWIEWARAAARDSTAPVQGAGYSAGDVDRLNLECYRQNRDRPLEDILSEFRETFPPLLEQVTTLEDADLSTVVQADWTGYEPATLAEIVSWRFWHYRAHGETIETWRRTL